MQLDKTHFLLIAVAAGLLLATGYFKNKNDLAGKQMEEMYAEQQAMQAEIDESREDQKEQMSSSHPSYLSGAGEEEKQVRPSYLGSPEEE